LLETQREQIPPISHRSHASVFVSFCRILPRRFKWRSKKD
jgi:hypothetical protein